ncbi:hypothetical protein [Microbacterium sp. SORGH_AS_0969]|uniref:hypothetical protein n=1 Tax=Microbacterium sp. SORGH_AS_0969 TaxID=3041793 RepID=UPI0027832822|nr:hypothetical protein [Microbacterium sp. SORGH_AS_0969]MDQ1073993.1 hypothetical protein [Microbacterium sp. SORGH_AS_0969]
MTEDHQAEVGEALARGGDRGGNDLDLLVGDVAAHVEDVGRVCRGAGGLDLDGVVDEPGADERFSAQALAAKPRRGEL